ncbi:SCO2400 family protein, partial [Streptomyces sp. NPDC055059]
MDYCSSCRRTLNGALVCPGCGAYAPDIAPPATTSLSSFPSSSAPSAHASAPSSFFGGSPAGASGAYAAAGSAEPFDDFDPFSAAKAFDVADAGGEAAAGSVDAPAPVAASQGGRAARRRKLAQWKKNKRRAVAATAVAIVGGGLTIAALPNDASPDRTHASAAPDPVATSPALANTDVATDTPDDRASRGGSDRSHKSTGPRHARPANTPTPAASTAPTGAPRHAAPARAPGRRRPRRGRRGHHRPRRAGPAYRRPLDT